MYELQAFVYIMASKSGTLYIGVTNDIERRVYEHKQEHQEGFTKKYHCTKLVYFQECTDICEAILLEKKMKGWKRSKKESCIACQNPGWNDLAKEWYGE